MNQLQELYRHLDGADGSANTRIAWYGQLRAEEQSHSEALEATIVRFKLRAQDWYQARFKEGQ